MPTWWLVSMVSQPPPLAQPPPPARRPPSAAASRNRSSFRQVALSVEPVTDKVTSHSYETMYAQFLTPLYASVQASGRRLKLLEIGMGCDMERGSPGASTLLWTRLLPGAEVWQAELHGDCAKALGSKLPVRVLVGDQADPAVVQEWVRDDGRRLRCDHRRRRATGTTKSRPRSTSCGRRCCPAASTSSRICTCRASPHGGGQFTVVDRLHSWSEQLLSLGRRGRNAATAANHRAHREKAKHPMPSDVAFVFVQRDAAVIGKLTSAGRTAQQAHLKFLDVGSEPLRDADEQRALTTIVKAAAAPRAARVLGEAALRAARGEAGRGERGGEMVVARARARATAAKRRRRRRACACC